MAPRAAKPKAPTAPKAKISVTLSTAGLQFTTTGDTIPEAISKLDPKVMKIRGILSVKSGDLNAQIPVMPLQMRRLSVNAMTREIVGKRLASLLR